MALYNVLLLLLLLLLRSNEQTKVVIVVVAVVGSNECFSCMSDVLIVIAISCVKSSCNLDFVFI